MSGSLPERPDLGQLRRQAKELRDAARRGDAAAVERFSRHHPAALQGVASLASAQLVIARELGFASWPRLKAAIDSAADAGRRVQAFVSAVIDGRLHQARDIFGADPDIARRGLLAATVLGDAEAVREVLAADPAAAVAIDEERGWPPLLYACYSRWPQIDPGRESGMAEVVRLLLDAGASPNTNDGDRTRYRSALRGSVELNNPGITEMLLDAGADPRATGEDGMSALRLAVRAGREDTAALLRAAGAPDDCTDVDRFIGACLTGDRQAAERLAADHPDLRGRLTDQDHAVIVEAAASRPAETIALMLDLGFSPRARRFGDEPLHNAAYHGNAATVGVLLGAGADIDARDGRFDSTPLAFATVGSREQAGRPGDWITTIRLLIEAGAAREGVWIPGKPPSEEVMDLLRRYGIGPSDSAEPQPEDVTEEVPGSIGTGVMADMARHLEAVYQDRDLDLLASLLHPQVSWTGICRNSEQVLDWYRGLLSDGTLATVHSVEVDRDAVLLGLSVALQAEGARPAPPQQLYQVFTVDGAQITDIRAYGDHASAVART